TRAEAERERLLAQLDATISSIADGVMIYDAAGNIARLNEGALRILGGYSEEERRQNFRQRAEEMRILKEDGSLFLPEDLPAQRALGGKTVLGVVMGLHRPPDRLVWVSASAAPIRGPEGETLGAVATFSDITQMRKLEEDRGEFVRIVSHDLRQPLTVIGGQAQILQRLLERRGIDGRVKGALEAIDVSARRMGRMIEELVQSARMEAGQLQLKVAPVDLRAHVVDLAQRMAATAGADRVVVEAPEGLPLVLADADRLERILDNLLS
ncbi:MAG: sensor histidine kinase, partial [Chloroflexota bacterium]